MNKKRLIVVSLIISLSLFGTVLAQDATMQATTKHSSEELTDDNFYMDKYILILQFMQDHDQALEFAEEASEKLEMDFSNENMEYSKEKGIYYSEENSDELDISGYYPRRYEGEYITLENSGAYGDIFIPGYIIVVGGVFNEKAKADNALSRMKETYQDAYLQKTEMWMGAYISPLVLEAVEK